MAEDTVVEGQGLEVPMTREDVYKEIGLAVGRSIDEALAPIKERQSYTKEIVDALRENYGRENKGDVKKGQVFRAVRCIAAARARSADEAARFAKDEWRDDELSKALSASEAGSGGVLLPSDMADELIDLLRPMTVVRKLGARTIDMPNGSIEIPKLTAGAAVGFTGENQTRRASQPETGNLVLTQKKLIGIVPASNDLLRSPRANADNLIRTDLTRGISTREDIAYIRDDGSENTPKGMKHWAQTQLTSVNSDPSSLAAADVIDDLRRLLDALENADVPMEEAAWIMSPRSKNYLRMLRGTDVFLFREEIDRGMLLGLPLGSTSQIPNNLDFTEEGDADESEIYLANMADALIGETGQIEVSAFSEGAYVDADGNMVSLISNDQSAIRAILRVDFAMRRRPSVVVLNGVVWGVTPPSS